jgi:TPR repeat protein
VKKNQKKAVEWYQKAAEQGDAIAQYNLGISYKEGQGVKKDKNKAAEWLSKAAAQGDEDAQKALQELGR